MCFLGPTSTYAGEQFKTILKHSGSLETAKLAQHVCVVLSLCSELCAIAPQIYSSVYSLLSLRMMSWQSSQFVSV